MLDDDEYARVAALISAGMTATPEFRRAHDIPLQGGSKGQLFAPALAEYLRITGFAETNHLAIHHHRLARHGPPCGSCGKPLRTPRARYCVACGARPA